LLEKVDGLLVRLHAKTGKDEDEMCRAWMDAETWFTADEALDIGFVDRKKAETKAKNTWNLPRTQGAQGLPDPESKATPEEPAAAGFFMSETNANRLRLALIA
jgi:ATP-dependent Clp protease protease subunit